MNLFTVSVLLACLCAVESISADRFKSNKTIIRIGQKEVCKTKHTCVHCLRLTHCSWCKTKCFSNVLESEKCKDATSMKYTDYGFSLQENAECSCHGQDIKPNCHPEDADQHSTRLCSGRGRCVCGRCICETYTNSTKMVMGEYCEYDNFSCDGPRCNEGPYSLNDPINQDE